jgi:hypothetical protein
MYIPGTYYLQYHTYRVFKNSLAPNSTLGKRHISMSYGPNVTSKDDLNSWEPTKGDQWSTFLRNRVFVKQTHRKVEQSWKIIEGNFSFLLSKPLSLLNKNTKKPLLSHDGGIVLSPWATVRLRPQRKLQRAEVKSEATNGTDFWWRQSYGREEPVFKAVSLSLSTMQKRLK